MTCPRLTSGFAEIVLVVRDVKLAARFYQAVIGLVPETIPTEKWAWVWVGEPGASPRLALSTGPLLFEEHSPYPEGSRWGPVHYAFRVDRSELESAASRARQFNIEVYGPTRLEWMKATSYYCYDPDGNLLEWWSPDPIETSHEP